MPVGCQRCSAIRPALTDPRDVGWQEMTCVASCFDGRRRGSVRRVPILSEPSRNPRTGRA
jgi:hypothetical protein